jgi:flagellin-like protein
MKGITPIISIIILLGITLAMAGFAYTYLMGELMPRISGSFTIAEQGGAFCTNNIITVQVTNTGTGTLQDEDFTIARVDGVTVPLLDVTIPPGEADIIMNYNCGGTCSSGAHTVDLGTEAVVKHPPVYCT